MANKQRRTSKDPSTCVEKVVKLTNAQQLVNNLEWIKFKANKGLFNEKEISHLIKLTADYKQI
jgi:hypothetical protein